MSTTEKLGVARDAFLLTHLSMAHCLTWLPIHRRQILANANFVQGTLGGYRGMSQTPPCLVAPRFGSCASLVRSWRLSRVRVEARPLGAKPLPWMLELAAIQKSSSHPGNGFK